MFKTIYAFLIFPLLLIGCSTISMDSSHSINIADGVQFTLVAPSNNIPDITQKVTSTYKNEQHISLMHLNSKNKRLTIVGLTPTGNRLFSITYDGIQVNSWKSPLFTAPLDGSFVIADYELVSLPLEIINQALVGAHASETFNNNQATRMIVDKNNKPIIEIIYSDAKNRNVANVSYHHLERQYQIRIEPLSP